LQILFESSFIYHPSFFFKSEDTSPLIHKLLNVAISTGATTIQFYIYKFKGKKQRKAIPVTARGGP
jgi:hypothetical protein